MVVAVMRLVVVMGFDCGEMREEGEMCVEERTRSCERREGK